MRGLFVTGTDTGVGKSVLSAALIAAMVAAGENVRAYKPVVTGLDEPPEPEARADADAGAGAWPPDHELLAGVAGMRPDEVSPVRFGPAVSPHLAARLAGRQLDATALHDGALPSPEAPADEIVVVEGVGGLLVPLSDSYTVRDLAVELALPLVISARPGLGTINHTLLTIESARGVGLTVAAVVLTPWPDDPGELEHSNRETIARLGNISVLTLDHISGADAHLLARAAVELPWRTWLAPPMA